LAALVGGLMFCIAVRCRDVPNFAYGLTNVHRFIAGLVIVVRVFVYLVGHVPPISLLGRFATRRFIIPGYDVMFAAPALAGAVACLGPELLMWVGVLPVAAVPLSTAATIWIVLAVPPDLETWHYTGHFRIPTDTGRQRDVVRA
jgi:hypothetical protein